MAIFVIILLLVIACALFYGYKTAQLKRSVRYFVSAIVMRQNQWFAKEGFKRLAIWHNQNLVRESTFWKQGIEWRLTSADQIELSAKVFQQKSTKWVVCLHSYRKDGLSDCQTAAENFYQKGYNVIVPDLRGHGKSEGTKIGLGWLDRLDLILWIRRIMKEDEGSQIILYGQGMGAATLLLASGEVLPKQVKLLIADSSYTSIYSVMRTSLPKVAVFSVKRFLRLANRYSKQYVGYPFLQISVTRQLGSNHLPVLFLHGKADRFLPVNETATLMEATAGAKKLVLFDQMDHLQAKESEEYWQEIFQFMEEFQL